MSFAVVNSRALCGMNAPLVEVEVHLANGLPQCNLVGLPDTEVKESRDRVRAAILQSGFEFPMQKITVNLAPANSYCAKWSQAICPLAAMNPCPCGYLGHPSKPCRCTPDSIKRYRDRISGPLLDRIDLTIEVPALSAADLVNAQAGEGSGSVLQRVLAARERQYARQGKTNARLSATELDSEARIGTEAREALGAMLEKLSLSARSFHRILRVARTLADLAGDEEVSRQHVIRAISFRRAV